MKPRRQQGIEHPCGVYLVLGSQLNLVPAQVVSDIQRPGIQIAGNRRQRRVGQEINGALVPSPADPFVDGFDRPGDAKIVQTVANRLCIGEDDRVDFPVNKGGRAPPQETHQDQGREDEDAGIGKGQLDSRRAQQPNHPRQAGTRPP